MPILGFILVIGLGAIIFRRSAHAEMKSELERTLSRLATKDPTLTSQDLLRAANISQALGLSQSSFLANEAQKLSKLEVLRTRLR